VPIEHKIVNGYKIPGGLGGIAVRYACELVIRTPGISQQNLLKSAAAMSYLDISHIGWLCSPHGINSPAGLLWDRDKRLVPDNQKKVFKCFPNEFTEQGTGSTAAIKEYIVKNSRIACAHFWDKKPGDLILGKRLKEWDVPDAVLIGFCELTTFVDHTRRIFTSFDEWANYQQMTVNANTILVAKLLINGKLCLFNRGRIFANP